MRKRGSIRHNIKDRTTSSTKYKFSDYIIPNNCLCCIVPRSSLGRGNGLQCFDQRLALVPRASPFSPVARATRCTRIDLIDISEASIHFIKSDSTPPSAHNGRPTQPPSSLAFAFKPPSKVSQSHQKRARYQMSSKQYAQNLV